MTRQSGNSVNALAAEEPQKHGTLAMTQMIKSYAQSTNQIPDKVGMIISYFRFCLP